MEYPEPFTMESSPVPMSTDDIQQEDIIKVELELIKKLTPASNKEIEKRKVNLGTVTQKYTLMLDLDETLIYSRGGSIKLYFLIIYS